MQGSQKVVHIDENLDHILWIKVGKKQGACGCYDHTTKRLKDQKTKRPKDQKTKRQRDQNDIK